MPLSNNPLIISEPEILKINLMYNSLKIYFFSAKEWLSIHELTIQSSANCSKSYKRRPSYPNYFFLQ